MQNISRDPVKRLATLLTHEYSTKLEKPCHGESYFFFVSSLVIKKSKRFDNIGTSRGPAVAENKQPEK